MCCSFSFIKSDKYLLVLRPDQQTSFLPFIIKLSYKTLLMYWDTINQDTQHSYFTAGRIF